jgi:hypothetical protein
MLGYPRTGIVGVKPYDFIVRMLLAIRFVCDASLKRSAKQTRSIYLADQDRNT